MTLGSETLTATAAVLDGRLAGAAEDFTNPRTNVQAFRHAGTTWCSLHAESLLCGVTRVYPAEQDFDVAIEDFVAAWQAEMQAMLTRALKAGARP